jgi:hypothetical protein
MYIKKLERGTFERSVLAGNTIMKWGKAGIGELQKAP